MQKNIETLTTFLPEELLAMSGEHEYFEMNRYRLISLRFLTFNAGISRLLEALSNENEQRLQTLTQAADRLGVKDLPSINVPLYPIFNENNFHGFFVIGNEMAAGIMAESLIHEQRSLDLYRQIRSANMMPCLDKILVIFIEQALIQCHILQDIQEQLLLEEPALNSQAA